MRLVRIEEQIKMIIADLTIFSSEELFVDDRLSDVGIDASMIEQLVLRLFDLFGVVVDISELSLSTTLCELIELISETNMKG